ncbi:helix-turn-helix transcriptional regulator [Atopobium deltae]|uniref:DNA-binding helix-turn-helix protein n=1 Tax=Atopobium deltae TaxID=1393034 RepID=A0A133XV70_9ACTN|nr:DNA-binding helix-turn-helix protein [Atopobium deltae]
MVTETTRSLKLRDIRKIARFTQEQVAGILGVSTPTYIKLEKNPELLTIEDARRLAQLFNVSVTQIFFDEKL